MEKAELEKLIERYTQEKANVAMMIKQREDAIKQLQLELENLRQNEQRLDGAILALRNLQAQQAAQQPESGPNVSV